MTDSILERNPLALVEQEVSRVIEDLDLHSYYQLLEVEPQASGALIAKHHEVMTQHYALIADHPACTSGLRSDLALIRERLDEALQVLGDPRLRAGYDQRLELGETRVALRQTSTGTFSLDDFDREVRGVTPPRATGIDPLASDPAPPAGLDLPVAPAAQEPPAPRRRPGPAPLAAVGYPAPEESFIDEAEPAAERSSAILRQFMQAVDNVVVADDSPELLDEDTERMEGLPIPLLDRRGE